MGLLDAKCGSTFSLACEYLEGEGTTGDPVDLTGYTVTSQLRSTDGTLVANLTVTVDDADAGEFTLSATAAATLLWTPGPHVCDVRFVAPSADIYTSQTFVLNVRSSVTVAVV